MPVPKVKSAGRVLEVLETFRDAERPLTAADLSHRLGYPLSSASVLLRHLAASGYLSLDADSRSYFPAARLVALGEWLSRRNLIDPALTAAAAELKRRFGDTVAVTVPVGTEIEFVYMEASLQHFSLAIRPGARVAICRTMNGLTWLAAQPDDAVREMVIAHNEHAPQAEMVVEQGVMRRVRAIRQVSYGAGQSPIFPGFAIVSMPVIDRCHDRTVVIAVSMLAGELASKERRVFAIMSTLLRGLRVPLKAGGGGSRG